MSLMTKREKMFREIILTQEALNLKALKGSVVDEKIACGKPSCSTCHGTQYSHPRNGYYKYLHFQDKSSGSGPPWPVRKKYLSKRLAELMELPVDELLRRKLSDLELCHKTEEKGVTENC